MHDIKAIRENPRAFDEGLARRSLPSRAESLLALDDRRRAAILELQKAQERRNAASKEIGAAMARKDLQAAEDLKAEVAGLKAVMPELEAAERNAGAKLDAELAAIPNLPAPDTPDGKDEKDNVEVRRFGAPPKFPDGFTPREHFDIGEALGLMDFDAAAKLSGARFVVLKGALARLERALLQFMLDLHTREHGYLEINPPVLVRSPAMFGTAQLPKFREDQFAASAIKIIDFKRFFEQGPDVSRAVQDLISVYNSGGGDDEIRAALAKVPESTSGREDLVRHFTEREFWLIPTAEVPMTNLVRESIVDEKRLPLRFTAGTLCFRDEAGAAGKDARGMIRQHQFEKVELVSITTPEDSAIEHERMTRCAEEVLKRLGLHFRTVALCTGDMGFASQKTYDIEVWLPGQGRFREISSCSTCGDFQARRMNARCKGTDAKHTRFVHTLNGSGVAVGRALVAVMENYQNPDGSVSIPEVLRPYMGGLTRIEAKQ
ncbi:MAG: serine--tRNA ligase [Roseiarcus sp.]